MKEKLTTLIGSADRPTLYTQCDCQSSTDECAGARETGTDTQIDRPTATAAAADMMAHQSYQPATTQQQQQQREYLSQ